MGTVLKRGHEPTKVIGRRYLDGKAGFNEVVAPFVQLEGNDLKVVPETFF